MTQAATQFDELHLSYSQINTFMTCSLKYYFHYVQRAEPERISVALPFGKTIHSAIERYYKQIKLNGSVEDPVTLGDFFEETFLCNTADDSVPLVFNKTTPDIKGCVDMGRAMLDTFCNKNPVLESDAEIVGIELPLAAGLYNENRESLDLKLVGVVDLLLKRPDGQLVAVDYKTSASAYQQGDVDQDLQMSAYSYLLTANHLAAPKSPTQGEFHVLRKLKKPKLELHKTRRGPADRKRFAKVAGLVATAIEQRLYIPNRSYLCKSCQYANLCKNW